MLKTWFNSMYQKFIKNFIKKYLTNKTQYDKIYNIKRKEVKTLWKKQHYLPTAL